MAERVVRLGVVGCGAVTQICHLPAARRTQEVKIIALADKNIDRARSLGRRFGIDRCAEDYHEFAGTVDGMIVALPHALHAPVACDLLNMKIPVLVEKPLAPTVEEARQMIDTARAAGVPLQVGQTFRFSRTARLVKRVLDEGWLGPLERFTLECGGIYSWPVASGFFWRKEQAGGGVLIDTGAHMLDLLLWWLGDVVDVEYRDDSLGGIEADCRLSLVFKAPTGVVRGEAGFSRVRRLGCGARFVGERFVLECSLSGQYEVRVRPRGWSGQDPMFVSRFDPQPPDTFGGMFAEQLLAFGRAIRDGTPPIVSGESVLGSLALIERCYRERKPLAMPWLGVRTC